MLVHVTLPVLEMLGKAKVCQLNIAILSKHDVFRLQIPELVRHRAMSSGFCMTDQNLTTLA